MLKISSFAVLLLVVCTVHAENTASSISSSFYEKSLDERHKYSGDVIKSIQTAFKDKDGNPIKIMGKPFAEYVDDTYSLKEATYYFYQDHFKMRTGESEVDFGNTTGGIAVALDDKRRVLGVALSPPVSCDPKAWPLKCDYSKKVTQYIFLNRNQGNIERVDKALSNWLYEFNEDVQVLTDEPPDGAPSDSKKSLYAYSRIISGTLVYRYIQ